MKARNNARIAGLVVLTVVLLSISPRPFSVRTPKDINVILLTVDSLRADHLSCYNDTRKTTPNIDAIAAKGQVFRRAYAQSGWTIPGLMSILTSLQPPVHEVENRGAMLDPGITTIFDCFHDAGYKLPNICFLLTLPEFSGIRVGPVDRQYFSGEEGEELFKWLDENHDSKFFLWYHYRNVHLPYKPRDISHSQFLSSKPKMDQLSPGIKAVLSEAATIPLGTVTFEESDRPIIEDLYSAEVKELDVFVGRLYSRLQKFGLVGKTLIVITADHGEELMDHGFVGHTSTSCAANLHDEVLRIPLIMSLTDYLPRVEIKEQVQQIDIMPTILDIAGIRIPSGVQGRSLAPLIFDARKQNEASIPVFAETVYGGYNATQEMTKTHLRCVHTDSWKLIETESPTGKTYELYDLLIDPNEHQNIYAQNSQAASALVTLLKEWRRENTIRRQAITTGQTPVITAEGQAGCAEMLFPYEGAVLRFDERNGMIRASWTGSPTMTYIVEYEVGTGPYHLTGSFLTYGNQRDFGPYTKELWDALGARNPWRIRISPDTQPRCWSEWLQFTFE